MTVELQEPTPELADRLRTELPQGEHLTGLKMSVMGGSNPVPLYSLAEAASFVKIGTYEDAMRPNNQETIGYIDLPALERWIRGVFGDVELADAIQAEIETGEAFGKVAPRVRELLMTRAIQVTAPKPEPTAEAEATAEDKATGAAS